VAKSNAGDLDQRLLSYKADISTNDESGISTPSSDLVQAARAGNLDLQSALIQTAAVARFESEWEAHLADRGIRSTSIKRNAKNTRNES
jgi:hypothetical protein